MSALTGLLDQSLNGRGSVVSIVGPAGIGKSRLVREVADIASSRGVEVYRTVCESHTSDLSFGAVAPLLREAFGITSRDGGAARSQVRAAIGTTDEHDLILLDDLLGIRDPGVAVPEIDPDARRRRLAAMIKTASVASDIPGVYIIEDVHWIDDVSESMLADFLSVIPQTKFLVMVTYRPEYKGALANTRNSQTINLVPLSRDQTSVLTDRLLGSDGSVRELAAHVAQRADGNPFFSQEIVRDLAEQGVIAGERGEYTSRRHIADVEVPATLQATIAARIDRLDITAKRALNAAAVIGSRFSEDELASALGDSGIEPTMSELLNVDLVDQVAFNPQAEFVFRHPMIRTVAYESQLTSARAKVHRRLAARISDRGDPDASAALIAGHLEAAGDLRGAFDWHMRAGTWFTNRDISAARNSWLRARDVADRLPAGDVDRATMRLAPRTLLCGTAWRVSGYAADIGYEELRELATEVGDQASLAIGLAGLVTDSNFRELHDKASALASELIELLENIGDPALTVGLSFGTLVAKIQAGHCAEAFDFADRVVDLAGGDPARGDMIIGSPLAVALVGRGLAGYSLGVPGFWHDIEEGMRIARAADTGSRVLATAMWYSSAMTNSVIVPNRQALEDTAAALALAAESGDDFALGAAKFTRGAFLAAREGAERSEGLSLLAEVREYALVRRFSAITIHMADVAIARSKMSYGDLDAAVNVCRAMVDRLLRTGEKGVVVSAMAILVESLVRRGQDDDREAAHATVNRLAEISFDPGFILCDVEMLHMRALLAQADGDDLNYRQNAAQ